MNVNILLTAILSRSFITNIHSLILTYHSSPQVGRVIGTNGANIQAIKARSGALQVRIQKDPRVSNNIELISIIAIVIICFI